MNVRRSLNSALTDTPDIKSPEIQAFISGGKPVDPVRTELPKQAAAKPAEPAVELVRVTDEAPVQEVKEAKPKRSARPHTTPQPLHSKVMISVTTRFEQRTADALRRAHLEQKLKSIEPETQQEIIEIAVQAWLRDHDYLD
jgi:hypothetical protein